MTKNQFFNSLKSKSVTEIIMGRERVLGKDSPYSKDNKIFKKNLIFNPRVSSTQSKQIGGTNIDFPVGHVNKLHEIKSPNPNFLMVSYRCS